MDLFIPPLKQPLATGMRPKELSEFIGQEHLVGEDPLFLFRRMLIFASEDVGMADLTTLTVVESSVKAFQQCSMSE